MKVEYIVILDTKTDFCKTVNSFKCFLQSDSNIEISNSEIHFKGSCFGYSLQDGNIKDNLHYYNISIEFDCTVDQKPSNDLKTFEELLRAIKVLMGTAKAKVEVVWDDVGLYYAEKAYGKIFKVENLMRKLITKFMLINVSANWEKENVPSKILTLKERNKNRSRGQGYLYDLDFIDLADFLFDEYQISNIGELKKLYNNRKQIRIEELEKFIPLSNWEKFFKKIVSVEGDYLKKRWNELYALRCSVAHNIGINASEYERVCVLCKEICEPLEQTIEELDKVTVDDESKELLAENIAVNKAEQVGLFLIDYKKLENTILNCLFRNGLKVKESFQLNKAIELLLQKDLIDEILYKDLRNIIYFRNKIIHQTDEFDEQVIQNLKDACNKIIELENMVNKVEK